MNNRIKIVILISCLLMGISTASGNVYLTSEDSLDWQLRKDKNGIKVWTRNHKEEGILEYLAVAKIETSIDRLIEILRDVENYPAWTENCETAAIFKVLSDSSHIEYMTTNVPWPLEDRDVVMEFVVSRHTDDYYEVSLKSVPEAVPPSEHHVRIVISEGSWIFKKTEEAGIEVIHQFLSDPGGNIPTWIVNMFIVSGPFKTLQNLKDLSEGEQE